MSYRKGFMLFMVVAFLFMSGCSSGLGGAVDMIGSLTKGLGISPTQAIGSVGAVLGLAKEKLGGGDFAKIASVIPGSDGIMKQAGELLGNTGTIGNVAGLVPLFGKLGISGDTITKVVPAVTDFVGKAGGDTVGNLLKNVLK
jgi:hypothetical protein